MRAEEFLKETASAGATASGNVATVVKPLQGDKKPSFFGGEADDFPEYGDTGNIAIIRRPSPISKK